MLMLNIEEGSRKSRLNFKIFKPIDNILFCKQLESFGTGVSLFRDIITVFFSYFYF